MDPPHPERSPAVRVGELVAGRYQVERLLRRGGMGAVFLAHDRERDEVVALKTLLPDVVDDADLARFEREAQLAARVDHHDGVVRVRAFGRHGRIPYCVMERVAGEPLDDVFGGEPFPPERLVPIVRRLAETLARCHAEGVLHRDLKPANVILQAGDRPKLLDFGLARDIGAAERLTRTGELLGTPSYVAPEQARDTARATDPRVDVYGLGAILYHGLTGRPPYVGSPIQVLSALGVTPPLAPRTLVPDLPPDLEAVCLQALALDPRDRYPEMSALVADLERLERGEEVRARPRTASERWSRALQSAQTRRTLALTLAIATALLGALALGYLGYLRPQRAARATLQDWETWSGAQLDPWVEGAELEADGAALADWRERLRAAARALGEPKATEARRGAERAAAYAALLDPERPTEARWVLALRGDDARAGLRRLRGVTHRDADGARRRLLARVLATGSPRPEELTAAVELLERAPDRAGSSTLRPRVAEAAHDQIVERALRQEPLETGTFDAVAPAGTPLRARVRAEAWTRCAPQVEAALRAGLSGERAADAAAGRLRPLLDLPPRLRAAPPQLDAVIRRVLQHAIAGWRAAREGEPRRRRAGGVVFLLAALSSHLAWRGTVPGLDALVRGFLYANPLKTDPGQVEAALALLERGWTHEPYVGDVLYTFRHLRRILSREALRPHVSRHAGARYIDLGHRKHTETWKRSEQRERLEQELRQVIASPQLAPIYRASARLYLAERLRDFVEDVTDPEARQALQRSAAEQLRLAHPRILTSPFPRMLRRCYELTVQTLPKVEDGIACYREAIGVHRARLARVEREGAAPERRTEERLQLAYLELGAARAIFYNGQRKAGYDLARAALQTCAELPARDPISWDARAFLADCELTFGQIPRAVELILPGLPEAGLPSTEFVHAAAKVLRRRGRPEDLTRALQLVRSANRLHDVHSLRQLQAELERKR